MLQAIENLTKEFLEISNNKSVRVISHHDTDGITSAAIMIKTLKRLDKKFSIRIVKNLEEDILKEELKRSEREILIFTDLASGSLDYFQDLKNPIFILDHHEINKEKLNNQIKIINPHLFDEEEICGAGLSYLFAKSISKDNIDLAPLAIMGMIGDRLESNISKINNIIIKDTKDLIIKKGLLIFSATRPLKRSLEYSTSTYIPGVTGSSIGVTELLRETGIPPDKTLCDLNDEEMSRLVTAIMLRRTKQNEKDSIIGNLYMLKFLNRKEDVRELSVLINACSRLGYSDIALAFCLENKEAEKTAQNIYIKYKQQLISSLKLIEEVEQNSIEKLIGNGFVIVNAKDEIKDTIIGTVMSMISSSMNYEEGTILIGMAYNQDKIKVSARTVGKGRNLKEILEKTVMNFEAEVGGHHNAAGCLIKKEYEKEFIDSLRKNLEIEVVKI
ncbi:MAG: DHH family phosphoesterase [Nanoarchaeota archaeon]|nr:DHH family phosphoesterase [Nanoarchaeota archaeon]